MRAEEEGEAAAEEYVARCCFSGSGSEQVRHPHTAASPRSTEPRHLGPLPLRPVAQLQQRGQAAGAGEALRGVVVGRAAGPGGQRLCPGQPPAPGGSRWGGGGGCPGRPLAGRGILRQLWDSGRTPERLLHVIYERRVNRKNRGSRSSVRSICMYVR